MNIYVRKVASEGINHHVEHCIVDSVAKTVLRSFSAACPIYRELVASYFRTFEIKGLVEAFHADCAEKSLSVPSERNLDFELPPESMSVSREMQLLTQRPDIGPCIDTQSAHHAFCSDTYGSLWTLQCSKKVPEGALQWLFCTDF